MRPFCDLLEICIFHDFIGEAAEIDSGLRCVVQGVENIRNCDAYCGQSREANTQNQYNQGVLYEHKYYNRAVLSNRFENTQA